MYSPMTVSGTVPKPATQVYQTARRLGGEKPYTLTSEDPATGRLAFSQGKTLFAWGYEFEVTVSDAGESAQVEVTAGGKDGAPRAMLDAKKHEKAASKFLQALVSA